MSERTKTVELQGRRWQLAKINALDGSDIIRKLLSSGEKQPQEWLAKMSDDQFKNIQKILLDNVSEIQIIGEKEVMLPIILPSGVMSGAIAEDAGLVFMLTIVALMFNVSGFFGGNALKDFQTVVENFNV